MVITSMSNTLPRIHFALSFSLVGNQTQRCSIGLEGLPLLTDVFHLALSLEIRLLALPALVSVAWIFVVSVAVAAL